MQATTAIQTPGGAAAAFSGWTIIILILMAVGAAAIVVGMIYGNSLARQRHRAQEAAEERAEEAGIEPIPAPSSAVEDPSQAIVREKDPADQAVDRKSELRPEPAADDGKSARAPRQAPRPAAAAPAASSAPTPSSPPTPTPIPTIQPAIAGALALTTIKGLGPKVAALLAEQGVTRVDQLAALDDAGAAALDAKLGTFAGRMARDRWIDQARLLAGGDTAAYEAAFGKLG